MEISEACPDLTVKVSVDDISNVITINCCPPVLKVPRRNQYVVLEFRLEKCAIADYCFPPVGAVLVNPEDPQFPVVSWTGPDGTVARLLDLNTDTGQHGYTVNVIRRFAYQATGIVQNGFVPAS